MEIKFFFTFSDDYTPSTFRSPPVGLKNDDDINLTKGNYNGINFPVFFRQSAGKKFMDVLGTEYPSLYLISDRMKIILEEASLTGWKSYPIKLYDKKGKEIFGYHGFSVTGTCGPINYKKSEIIEKIVIPEGPISKYYKGLYVGLDTWSGEDFFTPEKNLGIIITKKVEEVLKKEKITNIHLINLSDYEMSVKAVAILEKRNEH